MLKIEKIALRIRKRVEVFFTRKYWFFNGTGLGQETFMNMLIIVEFSRSFFPTTIANK